jgi:hypothetical protein
VDKPEDSIYRAIDLLRSQKEKETGFRARKFVEQSSWESITDRFEEILKEVVTKK